MFKNSIKPGLPGLRRSVLFLFLLSAQMSGGAWAAAAEKFKMTVSVGPPLYFENGAGFFSELTTEIFNRLDIEHEMIWLPPQRSLVYTNSGNYDGHIARTPAIEAKFSNLLRVPINIFDFEFMAFTKKPDLKITGWESLLPYSVGMINGWKIVEQNTAGAISVLKANDYEQLLSLLDKERVDVAVLERVMGGWQMKQLGYDILIIEPAIATEPNFIYLHKGHFELVPKIARVIEEMKLDGTFDAIYAKSLSAH